jgi:hypothetical protein
MFLHVHTGGKGKTMNYGEHEDGGVRGKAGCFAHELRGVADEIERNPGLMTEEDPYDAALQVLADRDAIEGGYYDPGDFGSDAEG